MLRKKVQLLGAEEMERILRRIACEIVEKNRGMEGLVLVGIQRRGVLLAQRIAERIIGEGYIAPAVGELDITLYRDDLTLLHDHPIVRRTEIPGGVDQRHLFLVDDVIYTGRTIRAALDAVMDMGRPACVRLVVLIDRGQRELPIHPDIAGKVIPTSRVESVEVQVAELDGADGVVLNERYDDVE